MNLTNVGNVEILSAPAGMDAGMNPTCVGYYICLYIAYRDGGNGDTSSEMGIPPCA